VYAARTLITVVLMILCSACASVTPVTSERKPTIHVIKKDYEIGKQKEINIGASIITVKDYYTTSTAKPQVKADSDFNISYCFANYNVHQGEIFRINGTFNDKGRKAYAIEPSSKDNPGYFVIYEDGTLSSTVLGPMRQVLMCSAKTEPSDIALKFVTEDKIDVTNGYVNFELIYTGKDNNSITVLYREFAPSDTAREAFYQNLKYPLNTEYIRFKDIRIKLNEVAGEYIRCTVVDDGLPATK
jgi:hypothetical protein